MERRAGTRHGLTFHFEGRGIESADWGELRFRYKVLTEGWTWFGLKLCDHPVGKGMQATWRLDGGKGLRPGDWREAVVDLSEPMYLWGDEPDTEAQWLCFRAMAERPASILLDDVRLVRPALRTRLVEHASSRDAEGRLGYRWHFELTNPGDVARAVRVAVDAAGLRAFRPAVSPARLHIPPRQTTRVAIALTPDGEPDVPPLTREQATVAFAALAEPRPLVYPVEIAAVTPLPPHNHPTLLVTKAEVEAIRAKVAKHAWARKSYDLLLRSADAALERPVKLPDRGGQWWHWYSCPKCGTRLTTRGPTKHYCKTCDKTYSGEPYDTVVLSRTHSGYARAVETLGLAFQLSGEKRYAAKAAEILLAYADRYLSYKRHTTRGHDRVGGGRVGPQTLDESTWLIPVVRGYDLIWETLPRQQRTAIAKKLLRPAARLIMEHRIGIHNIQCWKNSAVGLVGICLDEPKFLADAVTSSRGIHRQLARGILDDGMWFEGAWGYHYYTMSALVPLAEALRHVGVNVYTDRYRSFYAAPLEFALPNGRLPAVNDSGEANAYGPWTRYELAYARWRDPMFAALLQGRSRASVESLLYGEPELVESAKLPSGSRNYPVGGYAYLQTDAGRDAPVVLLDYAPHGGGHGHPDKLQLILYAGGEIVAPDPGCIHYGVPLHREWYKQTVSHNTVVVDGRSQKPCQGKLRFFHATPELAVASATADDAYTGVRFARTVAVLPGGIVVDLVELASDKPHTYDWLFHCYGKLETGLPLGTKLAPPGKANGYQHIRHARGCTTEKPVTARWVGEKVTVCLAMDPPRFTAEPLDTVYAGDGYGQPASRSLPTLLVRRQGKEVIFVSALRIGGEGARPAQVFAHGVPTGTALLTVRTDQGDSILKLPLALGGAFPVTGPEPMAVPEAEVAVLRTDRDLRVTAVAVASGTRLGALYGRPLFESSAKATASLSHGPDETWLLDLQTTGKTRITIHRLLADEHAVTTDKGEAVRSTWSDDGASLSFRAGTGRYRIRPADE